MGKRRRGPVGEDPDPDGDGADACFFGVFFINLDWLKAYNVDARKSDLGTVSKLDDITDIH